MDIHLILHPFTSQKPGAKNLKEYDLKTFDQDEWSPKSPDSNPLDCYFWNKVKANVNDGRHNKPFKYKNKMMK